MIRFVVALVDLLSCAPLLAETERQAEARLAPKYNAQQEVRCPGGERADLVNETHAFEIEWAKPEKQWESIGQSLFYAHELQKEPAIILLVTDPIAQAPVVATMRRRCERMGIALFIEEATAEPKVKVRRRLRG